MFPALFIVLLFSFNNFALPVTGYRDITQREEQDWGQGRFMRYIRAFCAEGSLKFGWFDRSDSSDLPRIGFLAAKLL